MPPRTAGFFTMDQLEKDRDRIKNKVIWLEKIVKEHNDSTKQLSLLKVTQYTTLVEDLYERIDAIYDKINSICPTADAAGHTLEYEITTERILDVKEDLHTIHEALSPPKTSSSTHTTSSSSSDVHLPKLQIPTFDGKLIEWNSFRDLYTSTIHSKATISQVQKFAYLKSLVKGEALRLIQALPLTEASYDTAWKTLCDRYQNDRELLFAIIRRFDQLPRLQCDSLIGIRTLIDVTSECIRSLEAQSFDLDKTSDALFLYHILCKMDVTSKRQWELSHPGTNVPKVAELLEFLERHARSITPMSGDIRIKKPDTVVTYHPAAKNRPMVHHANESPKCKICNKPGHPLFKCPSFLSQSVSARVDSLKTHSFCFNCLQPGHTVQACDSKGRCRSCQGKHNTLIHRNQEVNGRPNNHESTQANSEQANHSQSQVPSSNALLATAIVRVQDIYGTTQTCRAFLDGGSTASFITESCMQRLGLHRSKTSTEIVGLSSASVGTARGIVQLFMQPHFQSHHTFNVNALILNRLTGSLPTTSKNTTNWDHLKSLQLADPNFSKPAPIDILLGSDIFWDLLQDGRRTGHPDAPIALNSSLGWLVAGKTESKQCRVRVFHTDVLDQSLRRFWEIENVPIIRKMTAYERLCEEHFMSTHKRDPDGRFIVSIPWKSPQESLGDTRRMALRRFTQLESRLKANPDHYNTYKAFMAEYIQLGHMEKVPKSEQDNPRNPVSYLPHHFVIKMDSSTTKFRVVFDGSAKSTSGKSLNDLMMVGPKVQDNLTDLIMRFRTHPIAFTADVAKMYRQIKIHEPDADMQRIFWRESSDLPLQEYRLITVTYGIAAAPFLATRCLKQLAVENEEKFPIASPIMLNDFYVDDLMTGSSNVKQAIQAHEELIELCNLGCFELRKWCSNSKELLSHIPSDLHELKLQQSQCSFGGRTPRNETVEESGDQFQCVLGKRRESGTSSPSPITTSNFSGNGPTINYSKNIIPNSIKDSANTNIDMTSQFSESSNQSVKCLGVCWNTEDDIFYFKVNLPLEDTAIQTKRTVLSEISKLFDPLGWLAPVVVEAKIYMQSIWKLDIDWDQPIPPNLHEYWNQYKRSLHDLTRLRIPRCVIPNNYIAVELAGFSDASIKAYAAVVFVRVLRNNMPPLNSNYTSKSRVAPTKQISLPRLELCGALLLAELMTTVRNALKHPISKVRAWTDSTIVLAWIKSDPSHLKTFVANRVSEIQDHIPPESWFHIPGIDNPSDCASRGISPTELLHHQLWWNGPDFLQHDDPSIPDLSMNDEECQLMQNEVKQQVIVATATSKFDVTDWILSRYSTLTRVLRITAWIRRIIYARYNKTSMDKTPLLPSELDGSLLRLISNKQEIVFHQEISRIRESQQLHQKSKLLSLNPYMDVSGLLRVGGRLRNAHVSSDQRNPILLPRHSRITDLLIHHYHHRNSHAGPSLLQSLLNQRFWIIRGRDAVRFAVRKCTTCSRYRATTLTQLMADLPKARVTPGLAFSKTGVDFAGPFILKPDLPRSKISIKAYLSIFVCMKTRAVHLELVSSLSTEAFLGALKRFVSRRNRPSEMFSDCGTNFVGAANHLNEMMSLLSMEPAKSQIANQLTNEGIKWSFNPPGAPHFGGLWEAGVKSVKFHLSRIIGTARLTFEEMTTVLIQIEACLNSRPLSPMSSDPSDLNVLTPGHFLTGAPLNAVPEADITQLQTSRLNRWQHVQQIQQHFWKRWSAEYLSRLQQRPKWCTPTKQPTIGDLVLIKHENLPPQRWKLGRITNLFPGADGLVRVASLKTSDGTLTRPIAKLSLLPISQEDTEVSNDSL